MIDQSFYTLKMICQQTRNLFDQQRTAILVDYDNVSPALLTTLMATQSVRELRCNVVEKIAFRTWSKTASERWRSVLTHFGFHSTHIHQVAKGKNAVDIALTSAALGLIYEKQISRIVLVASDSDYVPLAQHIQRLQKEIWIFGDSRTPKSLRQSATRFHSVEPRDQASDVKKKVKPEPQKAEQSKTVFPLFHQSVPNLVQRVDQVLDTLPTNSTGISLQELTRILQQNYGLTPENIGYPIYYRSK